MKNVAHVLFGEIKKPHGIRGGFIVNALNPEGRTLRDDLEVFVKDNQASFSSFIIDKVQYGNSLIVYFKNINNRTMIEELIPFKLYVQRADFPQLSKDEFYLDDLKGLEVLNEQAQSIGVVDDYYHNGAQAVLSLKLSAQQVEIPYCDSFVKHIDFSNRTVQVVLPEIL